MMNDNFKFELKKAIVYGGDSNIFKNWQEFTGITKEEFVAGLEWLCADPCDKHGRLTRELGCTQGRGIVKLVCTYDRTGLHLWEEGSDIPWGGYIDVYTGKAFPSISARDSISDRGNLPHIQKPPGKDVAHTGHDGKLYSWYECVQLAKSIPVSTSVSLYTSDPFHRTDMPVMRRLYRNRCNIIERIVKKLREEYLDEHRCEEILKLVGSDGYTEEYRALERLRDSMFNDFFKFETSGGEGPIGKAMAELEKGMKESVIAAFENSVTFGRARAFALYKEFTDELYGGCANRRREWGEDETEVNF
jgi:hypothetical protein